MRGANYWVMDKHHIEGAVVLNDVGPWDVFPTITNDAENVVARVIEGGLLTPGMRLLYYDSEGRLDEIVVVNGRFAGFAPYRLETPKRSEER